MRLAKLPIDVGPMHPRLREFWKRTLESNARPRKQVSVEFDTVAADVELRIRHHLPQTPDGWGLLNQDIAGSVYQTRPPDKYYIYLASDTAAMTAKLDIG